jgi:Tfp pilus assembly protein PilZ
MNKRSNTSNSLIYEYEFMEEQKDRRSFDRLEIPGMNAILLRGQWYQILSYKLFFRLLKFLFKKTQLKNISVSGACISNDRNYNKGDQVHMIISVPGATYIPVKGSVRWSKDIAGNNGFAGVQFEAFSSGKKFNSYNSLKQLQNHAKAKVADPLNIN